MEILSDKELTIKTDAYGAELTSIVSNTSGREYLWNADPVFWKRHSPILFPIVGSLNNNRYIHEGNTYTMSQHGFARDMNFELASETLSGIKYRLIENETSLKIYPFHFQLQIGYTLDKNSIEVIWEVKNTGSENLYFQIGGHPAFYYKNPDFNRSERGFLRFYEKNEISYYCFDELNRSLNILHRENLENEEMLINTHMFDKGALIIENKQAYKVSLLDMERRPYVTLTFDSPLLGLWSPAGNDTPFICIEPWYGRCDKPMYKGELKDRDYINKLETDESFLASYKITIAEED